MPFRTLKNIYREYIPRSDRILGFFLLLTASMGIILILINHFVTHYSGWDYKPFLFWRKFFLFLIMWHIGLYFAKTRIGFTLRTLSVGQLTYCMAALLANGAQYTPFPLIDHFLFKTDQWLHINVVAMLAWTHQHVWIHKIFQLTYYSLNWQLLLLPLLLAFLLEKKATNELLLNVLLAYLIGILIYYFFPANGPANQMNSTYFNIAEYAANIKFYEIHHYQAVTTSLGGLLTFPSFHTVWLTQLTYAAYCRKWLFYPLLINNTFGILATLFLGWHYLLDVISGFLLAAILVPTIKALLREKYG